MLVVLHGTFITLKYQTQTDTHCRCSYTKCRSKAHIKPETLRCNHITDALISRHWLRVPERIAFKVAMLHVGYSGFNRAALQTLSVCLSVCQMRAL